MFINYYGSADAVLRKSDMVTVQGKKREWVDQNWL